VTCFDCSVPLFDDAHWDDERGVEVCDGCCPECSAWIATGLRWCVVHERLHHETTTRKIGTVRKGTDLCTAAAGLTRLATWGRPAPEPCEFVPLYAKSSDRRSAVSDPTAVEGLRTSAAISMAGHPTGSGPAPDDEAVTDVAALVPAIDPHPNEEATAPLQRPVA
jgi:hypothetical protein